MSEWQTRACGLLSVCLADVLLGCRWCRYLFNPTDDNPFNDDFKDGAQLVDGEGGRPGATVPHHACWMIWRSP